MEILIPFKETSKRCPGKNFTLFPFIMRWLEKSEHISPRHIHVISKSAKVREFVEPFGVDFMVEADNSRNGDLLAAAVVAQELGLDKYIMLPLTQPIRKHGLIQELDQMLQQDENVDFVTTFQMRTDRSLFFVQTDASGNADFLNPSTNRKGCMCPELPMLDGAIYGIKMQFMESILDSDDMNRDFWAGKFKVLENDVDFFLDIDTEKDMRQFQILKDFYLKEME